MTRARIVENCREFRNHGGHSTDSGFANAAGGMEDSWYLVSGNNQWSMGLTIGVVTMLNNGLVNI